MTPVASGSCSERTSAGQPWAASGARMTTIARRAQTGSAAVMARSTGTTLATARRVQAGSARPGSTGLGAPRRVPKAPIRSSGPGRSAGAGPTGSDPAGTWLLGLSGVITVRIVPYLKPSMWNTDR